jgi:hypothetical protein
MKDQRIPPHGNRNSIISEGQTICAYKEPLRVRKYPYRKKDHKVNKVTKVRQEVVKALPMVGVKPDWHEVEELESVPPVKVFRIATNKIT